MTKKKIKTKAMALMKHGKDDNNDDKEEAATRTNDNKEGEKKTPRKRIFRNFILVEAHRMSQLRKM